MQSSDDGTCLEEKEGRMVGVIKDMIGKEGRNDGTK